MMYGRFFVHQKKSSSRLYQKETLQLSNRFPGKSNKRGLAGYYQQMLQQEFILAIEKEKAIGFLTFIPDHFLQQKARNSCVIMLQR
jgi:hypothetical protein